MKFLVALTRATLCAAAVLVTSAAHAVLITFDTDAGGVALGAPSLFVNALPLTTLYAPLGVTFSGPDSGDGGAILDQAGNFGLNARSGTNFLAFNRNAVMNNGGQPRDPETITFASPVSSVSIFAGAGSAGTFVMEAFDEFNNLLDDDTVSVLAGTYSQLSVSGLGIVQVVLREQSGEALSFVFDDLEFTAQAVPEPAGLALLGLALAGLAGLRRRRPA